MECSLLDALEVFKLCHLYQMASFLLKLEQLFASRLSQSVATELYSCSGLFSEALKLRIRNYICCHAAELFTTEPSDWLKLSKSEMLDVCSDDQLSLPEVMVWRAVKRWALTNYPPPALQGHSSAEADSSSGNHQHRDALHSLLPCV
eukprot:RCo036223